MYGPDYGVNFNPAGGNEIFCNYMANYSTGALILPIEAFQFSIFSDGGPVLMSTRAFKKPSLNLCAFET